jgi:hypothetical protein
MSHPRAGTITYWHGGAARGPAGTRSTHEHRHGGVDAGSRGAARRERRRVPEAPTGEHEVNDFEDDYDVEAALLAMAADMGGGPTRDVDISALSPGERRAVLACLRERLGLLPPPPQQGH